MLIIVIALIALTDTTWSQARNKSDNEKPTVWVICMEPVEFGDFYNPFMRSMKTLRIGGRLKEVRSWNGSDFNPRPNDVWVYLLPQTLQGYSGSLYSVVFGWYDSCGNSVYASQHIGLWTGSDSYGKSQGYEIGTSVVEWISGIDGFNK